MTGEQRLEAQIRHIQKVLRAAPLPPIKKDEVISCLDAAANKLVHRGEVDRVGVVSGTIKRKARCGECGAVLARLTAAENLEIRCRRCKTDNTFNIGIL